MDRRNNPTQQVLDSGFRRGRTTASAMSSADGRWALVSTSLTALVAGTIAWLAMATIPPTGPLDSTREHALLPYQLFQQIAHPGSASYASLGPTFSSSPNNATRVQGEPQGSLDNDLAVDQAADNANPLPGVETHDITLDKGDTLVAALTDAGATPADASAAVIALSRVFNLRNLRAGQTFELSFQTGSQSIDVERPNDMTADVSLGGTSMDQNADSNGSFIPVPTTSAGRLLSMSFSPSVEHQVTVTRSAEGVFTANDAVKQLVAHVHRAGATIDSSLYLAAMQAGIPADVVVEMIHMFSYKVDFQRDLKPGDSFEVFYNYYYTTDGQPAKEGQISYAVMNLGRRQIALYRYQPDSGEPADYLDANGQSAKGMLMKTPVDGARITSGFGMRFHPILGYTRMHKGIDFGVPIGTPVMAAGAGTVAFMGVQHGYGNFVLINHGNGYSTAYGHLSRFAPGLRRGGRVRQGQVVAYSGMSGMATGPHLHYEIRVNNVQVNPVTVKIAQGIRLAGRALRQYLAERLAIDQQVASMKLETKLADAGSGLRQAKQK